MATAIRSPEIYASREAYARPEYFWAGVWGCYAVVRDAESLLVSYRPLAKLEDFVLSSLSRSPRVAN